MKRVLEILIRCKPDCLHMKRTVQVQVRMPDELIHEIDRLVASGRFASRSDAIRTIVALHQERERTREFYEMLMQRSKNAREKPEVLLPLEAVR